MSQATLLFSDTEDGGFTVEIRLEDGVFDGTRILTEAECAALRLFEAQSDSLAEAMKIQH